MFDHPVVDSLMRTGYPSAAKLFNCPICDEELTGTAEVYEGPNGAYLGCCHCVKIIDAESKWGFEDVGPFD